MERSSPTPNTDATRTVAAEVAVTCPTWCEVPAAEHARSLWANEGRSIHQTSAIVQDPADKRIWGQPPRFCPPIEVTLCMTTNPSGHEVESADVMINGAESTLEQMLLVARRIADLAILYRVTAPSG